MTVLLAIAVKPKDGGKPYFLMGSDSLRLIKTPIYSVDEEFLGYEDGYTRIEDSQKIFRINNKLIGMTGRFNFHLTEKLLSFLKEKDCEIEEFSRLAANFVKDYLMNDKEIVHNQRVTITIGSCDNSNPKISYIEAETKELPKVITDITEVPFQNAVHKISGNTKNTRDLEVNFLERVSNSNLNITTVRKAATEYLSKAAERNPDTCNQRIVFERLF